MTGAQSLPRKSAWVRTGDFFFRYRNAVFPVVLVALFATFRPPAQYLGSESLEEWKDVLAIAVALAGLAFRATVIGFAYIKRGGLNKRVYADNLVTEGFFGLCRNPLYLGNMLIYAGVFLMHGNPWVVGLGILGYWLIYESIIAAEEFFLRDKFGPGYADYCHDVPRWLPRLSRFSEALHGMRFNWKRVVVKDYTTMANAAMALLLLELLERYYARSTAEFLSDLALGTPFLAALLAATAFIALAKRWKWLRA